MKNRKLQIVLIVSTFVFLILLLFIQINRLIHTAETEKRHFTQSVKLSLNLAASEISQDRQMCRNVQSCLLDTQSVFTQKLRKSEWNKVDSIIKYNLEQYDIDLAYEFEIVYANTKPSSIYVAGPEISYSESLNVALQQGNIELWVRFPEKNKFIIERISTTFISSILLILLVTTSFIMTLSMYLKEKKLAVQTKNFINNMAHEFKTPLASIGFANSRIRNSKDIQLPEKLLKYTEIIDNEKAKLQEHLDEMLELACLESKNAVLKHENVDVKLLLEDAVKNACILVEEKKGNIQFDCTAGCTNVYGSKKHLLNSFSNIVENACKYSNGDLNIKISCYNIENQLITEFLDDGIGIAPKDQKLIFDKYYRVPTGNIHNIKGYGIGLSYVNEVIALHKGKIELSSKPGKGSNFKILLPIIKSVRL